MGCVSPSSTSSTASTRCGSASDTGATARSGATPPVGAEGLAGCEPVYEDRPGWSESTVGLRSEDGLPANARAYVDRLESLLDAPIDLISTGPDREETIVRRLPF